jgi:hypothetical protein
MKTFGMRMIVGGGGACLIGLLWFASGLSGEDLFGVLGGGIWKGPLLTLAGIGAVIMGARMLREDSRDTGLNPNEDLVSTVECPHCGRENSVNTPVCPQCETRLQR